ncbi:hypothetical protein ADL25_39295 [Streptomyces sp. NRRL F-5122]|nr:hypothetical protein ADL25_39295 [Streptomyces sp. NRRL F-5122]
MSAGEKRRLAKARQKSSTPLFQRRMDSLANQARTVSRLLSVRAVSIAVMVGPLQSGMHIRLNTIRIVSAEDLCDVLRLLDRQYLPHGGQARLVDTATRLLPPTPFATPPVLSALPVDPDPEDDERTVTAAVEEVTTWYAVVRVWRTRPRRGQGVASPAGDVVRVHLVAVDAAS